LSVLQLLSSLTKLPLPDIIFTSFDYLVVVPTLRDVRSLMGLLL